MDQATPSDKYTKRDRIPQQHYDLERVKDQSIAELARARYQTDLNRDRRGRCPVCDESKTGFAVSKDDRSWFCHAHGEGGSVIDLVMQAEGLPFKDALRLCAELAGIDADSAPMPRVDVAKREAERREREQERARTEAQERAQAAVTMAAKWDDYARTDERGGAYLRSRGIDFEARAKERMAAGGRAGNISLPSTGQARDEAAAAMRYRNGCPAVPAYCLTTGQIVGLQYRQIDPKARPKVLSESGSKLTGATFGKFELEGTSGPVFLVEGLIDYLTGRMLFAPHGSLVLGAPGACNVAGIVRAVAPALVRASRGLVIVMDDDGAGRDVALTAARIAIDAGLKLERHADLDDDATIDFFGLGGANDLNDAFCRGKGDAREYF